LEVDIDRVQIASEEITSYSKEMEKLLDRLYLVKMQIDRMSLGKYGISDQLHNMIGQTIRCNVIMKKHSSVLKQAYAEYNQTEVRIEEKYNGVIKNSNQEGGSTTEETSKGEIPEEIEDLKKKYENQEISDEELIRELVKLYGVKDYTSLPSYLCVINGTKYNPQKKEELVAEIAYALIYIKGGDKYIKEKYKEYEKKYAANYYDHNKNNHNTNYNVAPVDNPPKVSLEDFPAFLAEEEAKKIRENAYSGEELEKVLRTSVASLTAGAAMQYAYSKYGGKSYKGSSEGDLGESSKTIENALPNVDNATINTNKLTGYALNNEHPVGGNKAKVFESALGYNQSNADDLMRQVYDKLPSNKAVLGKLDQYGQRYTVDIPITGPNGNTVNVRTGWIIKNDSNVPELTTIFVKD
jgi:hypothetical protein